MRRISRQTYDLIDRLYEPNSPLGRLFRLRPDTTELIARIGAAGEPAAIPHLLPLVLGSDQTAAAAASAIHQLLEAVPVLELVPLGRWVRTTGAYWNDLSTRWYCLKPTELPRLGRLPHGWAVLALATMHRSGYVREAAVRQLAAAPAGKILPFLLLRMNDWVDPVRRAAEQAMEAFERSPDLETLVAMLPLLLQMQTWRRRELQPFVAHLLSLLQWPDARPALAHGLESPDRHVRRECFRLALSAPALEPEEASRLVERGLADPDVLVRVQAARHLGILDDESLRRLGAVARAHPSMPVRREALGISATRFPAEAARLLHEALLDSHASMREFARHRLQQPPSEFDPVAFYRAAVPSHTGQSLRAAILGLGETGSADDVARLLPFCSHARVKVREAAVRQRGRASHPILNVDPADISGGNEETVSILPKRTPADQQEQDRQDSPRLTKAHGERTPRCLRGQFMIAGAITCCPPERPHSSSVPAARGRVPARRSQR